MNLYCLQDTRRIGNRRWFLLNIPWNQFTGKLWRTFVNSIASERWKEASEEGANKHSNEWPFITSTQSGKQDLNMTRDQNQYPNENCHQNWNQNSDQNKDLNPNSGMLVTGCWINKRQQQRHYTRKVAMFSQNVANCIIGKDTSLTFIRVLAKMYQ